MTDRPAELFKQLTHGVYVIGVGREGNRNAFTTFYSGVGDAGLVQSSDAGSQHPPEPLFIDTVNAGRNAKRFRHNPVCNGGSPFGHPPYTLDHT
jgi:hypothetical protein